MPHQLDIIRLEIDEEGGDYQWVVHHAEKPCVEFDGVNTRSRRWRHWPMRWFYDAAQRICTSRQK
jgi:hypothetical protein